MSKNDLHPLRRQDLVVGVPIPFPIYDSQRKLLLNAGQVVHSEAQANTLFGMGLFHNQLWSLPRKGVPRDNEPLSAQAGITAMSVEMGKNTAGPVAASTQKRSFAQLKLLPGTMLQIQSTQDGSRQRSVVKLIGWQEKTSLIVSSINAQGVIVPFRDSEILAFKLVAGKDIVAFEAEVLKVCFSPFPYLLLSYPETLQHHPLRKNLRVNTQLITRVTLGANKQRHSGRVLNLSTGGALLELHNCTMNIGDESQLSLRLTAAGQEHVFSLGATVRNVFENEESSDEQTTRYGLQFTSVPVAERLVLENYILQIMVDA